MFIVGQASKWREETFFDNKKFYMVLNIGEKKTQLESDIKTQIPQGSQMKWIKAMQMIKLQEIDLRVRKM